MLRYLSLICIIFVHTVVSNNKETTYRYHFTETYNQKWPYVQIGPDGYGNTKICKFTHNDTMVYNYVKGDKKSIPNNTFVSSGCKLNFEEMPFDYGGTWTVETDDKTETNKIFVTNTIRTVKVQPKTAKMSVGQKVKFRLPLVPEETEYCLLTHKFNKLYNKAEGGVEFLEPRYDCGAMIEVNPGSTGTWAFARFVKGGKIYYGEFTINVVNDVKQAEYNLTTMLGTRDYIIKTKENSLTCELVNPQGNKVVQESSDCLYKIPIVSFDHAGVWTMYLFKEHDFNVYVEKYNLTVYESYIETSIIEDGSKIHLICNMTYETPAKFCHFEHPNGTRFIMYNMIGNEKYEYYSNVSDFTSMHVKESHYCGITIRSPDSSDYGTWRCYMKIQKSSQEIGAIIQLHTSKEAENQIVKKSSNVYVKQNDLFKLSCTANKKIKNCWMISPNGSIFVVSEKDEYSDFKYIGRGFSMGDCGVIIGNATDEYHGHWKCQLRLQDDERVESQMNVTVTNSAVIAKQDEIIYTGSPITMSCMVIPSETFDFDVCRWIKADGNGIHYESNQRYLLERNHRECSLVVAGENALGLWTVVVQSNIGSREIHSANILVYTGKTYNLNVIICVLTIVLFISCCAFFVYRSRTSLRNNTKMYLK